MNGQSMSDKLGLGPQTHEIKFGPSFMNSKTTSFHTLRYDFKPASVDPSKRAIVDVGSNHQVTVTVPHLDGCGTAQTVFKGSQRPYQKECVLIIDRDTGEITLEKLSACIQLKKTRQESSQKHHTGNTSLSGNSNNVSSNWSSSSENKKTSPPDSSSRQRHSSKLPKSLSARVPLNSPLQASPSYSHSHKSPNTSHTQKSPPQLTSNSGLSPTTTPGSLPVIGLSDMNDSPSTLFGTTCNNSMLDFTTSPRMGSPIRVDADEVSMDDGGAVGVLSETSSESSSDDSNLSDSDSDSNPSNDINKPSVINGQINGTLSPATTHENFLNEDLRLSESSGSDSD